MIRTILDVVATMMARRTASRAGTRANAIDPITVATGKDRTRTTGTIRFRRSRAGQLRILHAKTIVIGHVVVAMTAALERQMPQRQTAAITGLR